MKDTELFWQVSYSYPDSWAHAGTEAKYEVRFSTAVARAIPVRWL